MTPGEGPQETGKEKRGRGREKEREKRERKGASLVSRAPSGEKKQKKEKKEGGWRAQQVDLSLSPSSLSSNPSFHPLSSSSSSQSRGKGRLVRYDTGTVSRVGRILKVLSSPEETPRPPKILYEVYDEKRTKTKQYTNNPSALRVIDDEKGETEEGGGEGQEEEEGGS